MSDLLVPILVVEAVLLVLAFGAALGHAAWRGLRTWRLGARIDAAEDAIVGALAPGGPAAAGLLAQAALDRLPTREAVLLLARLGERVSGEASRQLGELAATGRAGARVARWARGRRVRARLRAARVLTATGGGHDVVPALIDDPDPHVRAQAAMWVVRHGDDTAVTALVRHTFADEGLTRFASADAVVRLGSRAAPALADALATGHGPSLVIPLRIAGHIGDLRVLPAVAPHCSAPEPEVRAEALRSSARLGGVAQEGRLVVALDDPDAAVRTAAVEGLGHVGAWRQAARIGEALRDPSWDVRRAAGMTLRSLDAPGGLVLRRALEDDDRFARDMARRALDEERVA